LTQTGNVELERTGIHLVVFTVQPVCVGRLLPVELRKHHEGVHGSLDALSALAYRWHLDLLNGEDKSNDESKVKLEGDVRVQFGSGTRIRGHSSSFP